MLLSKLQNSSFYYIRYDNNHNAERNFAVRQESHLEWAEIEIFLYLFYEQVCNQGVKVPPPPNMGKALITFIWRAAWSGHL